MDMGTVSEATVVEFLKK